MDPITVDSATALQPVGKMLVVRKDDPETMVGSIYLPSAEVEAPDTGTVIAVGPEVEFPGFPDPIGRRVAFTHYGGTEWDKEHTILRQEDIMCFIKKED